MRISLHLILFFFLFFFITSCEPEQILPSPPEETTTWTHLNESEEQALYREAATELEMTFAYGVAYIRDAEAGLPAPPDEPLTATPEELSSALSYYIQEGWIYAEDANALEEVLVFFGEVDWTGDTDLLVVANEIEAYRANKMIQQESHPLTYHTIGIVKEVLLNNPITRGNKAKSPAGIDKSPDGKLCKTIGFFCPSLGPIEAAARSAATAAGASVLKKVVLGAASGFAAVAIASIIKDALGIVWSGIFCRVECDECAGPAGILALYQGCGLKTIQAIGTFEFARRWMFVVDDNLDGTFDHTLTTISNSASGVSLPNSHFKVIADVRCDDSNFYEWAGPRNQPVSVYPNLNNSRPVAWLSGPPLQNGFLYPLNTELCFTLNELGDGAWQRAGWIAHTGSPSSSSSNGTFCTTFQGFSRPAWVGARYVNPCNTSQERFASASFVVIN